MAQENVAYRYCLTTIDNPFDPFEQPEAWLLYDELNHYDSNKKLASVARTSDEFSDSLNQEEIRGAILKIMALDPFNLYTMAKQQMPNYELN